MKIRIIVESEDEQRSEVWKGDLEILDDQIYIAKISFLGEGEPHPIVDIPFSKNVGWWQWHPGNPEREEHYTIPIDDRRSYYNIQGIGGAKP